MADACMQHAGCVRGTRLRSREGSIGRQWRLSEAGYSCRLLLAVVAACRNPNPSTQPRIVSGPRPDPGRHVHDIDTPIRGYTTL
jgi:hypothetical protein